MLIWLKRFLISLKDDEVLIKSIVSLLNDIWKKHNQVAHGDRVPLPQDIIRDSQSIVTSLALTFEEKACMTVHRQTSVAPNFSGTVERLGQEMGTPVILLLSHSGMF